MGTTLRSSSQDKHPERYPLLIKRNELDRI